MKECYYILISEGMLYILISEGMLLHTNYWRNVITYKLVKECYYILISEGMILHNN